MDREGRTIWIADAGRDDGKRFVVRADEILTAFLELQRAIQAVLSGAAPYSAACVLLHGIQIEDFSELLFEQRAR